MNQETAFTTLKSVFAEIIPEVDVSRVTLDVSLRDLGANSIDRADIITETMEQLEVSLPMVRFADARSIGDIVAVICEGGAAG